MTDVEKWIWKGAIAVGGITAAVVQPAYPIFFMIGTIITLGGIAIIACNIVGVVSQMGSNAPAHEVVQTLVQLSMWAVLVFACIVLITVGVFGPDHASIAAAN